MTIQRALIEIGLVFAGFAVIGLFFGVMMQ